MLNNLNQLLVQPLVDYLSNQSNFDTSKLTRQSFGELVNKDISIVIIVTCVILIILLTIGIFISHKTNYKHHKILKNINILLMFIFVIIGTLESLNFTLTKTNELTQEITTRYVTSKETSTTKDLSNNLGITVVYDSESRNEQTKFLYSKNGITENIGYDRYEIKVVDDQNQTVTDLNTDDVLKYGTIVDASIKTTTITDQLVLDKTYTLETRDELTLLITVKVSDSVASTIRQLSTFTDAN